MTKHILVFSPYFPPHIGGLENYIEEFCSHLARLGMRVVVFTSDLGMDHEPEKEVQGNLVVVRYPSFEIVSNYPCPKFWSRDFWVRWGDIREKNFDFQITNTRFFLSSLFPFLFGLARVRWIHIEHGSDFVLLSSRFKTAVAYLYDQFLGRLVFRKAYRLVAISPAVANFIKRFTKKEVKLIYPGLDTASIDKIDPRQSHLDESKLRVGFLGRLYRSKNVEGLIQAFNDLNLDEANLYIAGGGGDYQILRSKYESASVLFLGPLEKVEALAFLKNLDIFVLSTGHGGGLSKTLLEAMYCGPAVLASPLEGGSVMIQDGKTGVLLEDTSVPGIKKGLEKLIGNKKDWPLYKSNARRRILADFSWENTIREFETLFSES